LTYVKYYWLLEQNPEGWDLTDALISMGAIHISTIALKFYNSRRFIKQLTEEERLILVLKYGNRLVIHPATENDILSLTERGRIKS
jgi:hypothetical protein